VTLLTYYLRHRAVVEGYLDRRDSAVQRVRAANEGRFDPAGIHERLLARRSG
jgi:hypothetical protein